MNENSLSKPMLTPLGSIEPHAPLLKIPPEGTLLYKVTSIEHLLSSINNSYLHFNRVDSYVDFPGADQYDGSQLSDDISGNASAKFKKAPHFSAASYYDQSRARTYACCFSLENSQFIWDNYGNGSNKGKVCIVFNLSKLRAMLNQILQPGNDAIEYGGALCQQIFDINCGIIEYIDRESHRTNEARLPNPIQYTYLKDKKFFREKEFRISLSAFGMGQFVLERGCPMVFPPNLRLSFDFRAAIADGTTPELLCAPDADHDFIEAELRRLGVL